MSYDRNKPLTCASCGVPWIEHRGPQAICAELQTANKTIATLRATVADLVADIQLAEKTIEDLKYNLSGAKAELNKCNRQLEKLTKGG
jgi:chromosome segregation ATPase